MKVNCNTFVFKGYRNLIHTNIKSGNSEFTLFALQLNDEDGHKDLSSFKRVLKTIDEPETDVMTFVQIKDNNGIVRNTINNMPLLQAEELEFIDNPDMIKKYSKEALKSVERFNVQANTMLASITKRLMQNELVTKDSGIKHTISEVIKILKEKLPVAYVIDILDSAFMEKKHVYKSAWSINESIVNNMNKYFKV